MAGLLILQMIIYHLFLHAALRNNFLYSITYPLYFFMPWFFYKAGFFLQPQSIKECVIGGCKKLLRPFFIFSLIGHFFYCIHIYLSESCDFFSSSDYLITPVKQIIIEGACLGNSALWFLLTLFFVKVIYNILSALWIKDIYIIVFFVACAYIMNLLSLDKPLYMANICSGLVFYTLGHLLKDVQKGKVLFIASFAVYIVAALLGWNYIDMHMNVVQRGYYLLWVPTALAGIILFNNLFGFWRNIPILSYIGKKAIYFYVIHWIIITIAKILFSDLLMVCDKYRMLLLMIALEILMLPLLTMVLSNTKLKWTVGN